MNRLIDADALIALVQDSTILGDGFKYAFVALVKGEPTVDAVIPVRCKDCKWLGIGERGDGTRLVMCCKKYHDTTEEDYCSEGVNREDDPSN